MSKMMYSYHISHRYWIFLPKGVILNYNFKSGQVIMDLDPNPTSQVISDPDPDSKKFLIWADPQHWILFKYT